MPSAVPPPTRKAWAGGSRRKCRPFRSGRKPIPGFLSPTSAPSVPRGRKSVPSSHGGAPSAVPPEQGERPGGKPRGTWETGKPTAPPGPRPVPETAIKSPSKTGMHRNPACLSFHSYKPLPSLVRPWKERPAAGFIVHAHGEIKKGGAVRPAFPSDRLFEQQIRKPGYDPGEQDAQYQAEKLGCNKGND